MTTGSEICPVCKAAFAPTPGRARRFCTPACSEEGRRRRNRADAARRKRWQRSTERKDDLEPR